MLVKILLNFFSGKMIGCFQRPYRSAEYLRNLLVFHLVTPCLQITIKRQKTQVETWKLSCKIRIFRSTNQEEFSISVEMWRYVGANSVSGGIWTSKQSAGRQKRGKVSPLPRSNFHYTPRVKKARRGRRAPPFSPFRLCRNSSKRKPASGGSGRPVMSAAARRPPASRPP